jgi:hypothetical protein
VGPGRAGGNSGELSPAHMRSSIRASLSGRAEGHYSVELGTAHISEPAYQTSKCLEFSAEMGIAEMSQATKHTLSMQLMELSKASGCRGSGDGYYGLQDYFPAAPWRPSAAKTFHEKLSRLQLNKVRGVQDHTSRATLAHSRTIIRVSQDDRAPWTS